jgi:hypothetical protein
MTPEQTTKLTEWQAAKAAADAVKPTIEKEQALRKEVFALFFPAPIEGTNKFDLPEGWALKGTYKIDRKVDEQAVPAVTEALRSMGVNVDLLIGNEPKLKTATYRELTAEQRVIFDQALTIKPGSPTVELVAPKAK